MLDRTKVGNLKSFSPNPPYHACAPMHIHHIMHGQTGVNRLISNVFRIGLLVQDTVHVSSSCNIMQCFYGLRQWVTVSSYSYRKEECRGSRRKSEPCVHEEDHAQSHGECDCEAGWQKSHPPDYGV